MSKIKRALQNFHNFPDGKDIPSFNKDEIKQIFTYILRLENELEKANEQIEKANEQIEKANEQIENLNEQIENLNEQIEDLEQEVNNYQEKERHNEELIIFSGIDSKIILNNYM